MFWLTVASKPITPKFKGLKCTFYFAHNFGGSDLGRAQLVHMGSFSVVHRASAGSWVWRIHFPHESSLVMGGTLPCAFTSLPLCGVSLFRALHMILSGQPHFLHGSYFPSSKKHKLHPKWPSVLATTFNWSLPVSLRFQEMRNIIL